MKAGATRGKDRLASVYLKNVRGSLSRAKREEQGKRGGGKRDQEQRRLVTKKSEAPRGRHTKKELEVHCKGGKQFERGRRGVPAA